ncbi:hypothetical protein CKAN_00846000 [Cinnamomum micranthum f. kanehirae]|uniref:Uncharacterized protein n=1 Tax=Cinnamomum micranthum f. kanehirae TaxID=337451 RepID=A0A3S3MH78_9MAGN|nr:hypothetical protein CKAN_00846000 [Cinnamomum micranthum f. kanehirae]
MADLSLVEERPTFMMFLKPTANTSEEVVAIPSHHLIKEPMNQKPSKSLSMTKYKGWRHPQRK